MALCQGALSIIKIIFPNLFLILYKDFRKDFAFILLSEINIFFLSSDKKPKIWILLCNPVTNRRGFIPFCTHTFLDIESYKNVDSSSQSRANLGYFLFNIWIFFPEISYFVSRSFLPECWSRHKQAKLPFVQNSLHVSLRILYLSFFFYQFTNSFCRPWICRILLCNFRFYPCFLPSRKKCRLSASWSCFQSFQSFSGISLFPKKDKGMITLEYLSNISWSFSLKRMNQHQNSLFYLSITFFFVSFLQDNYLFFIHGSPPWISMLYAI